MPRNPESIGLAENVVKLVNNTIVVFEKWVVVGLLCGSVTLTFGNVVGRYLFATSFAWVEEVVIYQFLALSFISISVAARVGVHSGVDLLTSRLPRRWDWAASTFGIAITGLFGLFLTWMSIRFVLTMKDAGQLTILTEVPIWPLATPVVFGFAFTAWHFAGQVYHALRAGPLDQATSMDR